jgi:hypothetical protein
MLQFPGERGKALRHFHGMLFAFDDTRARDHRQRLPFTDLQFANAYEFTHSFDS